MLGIILKDSQVNPSGLQLRHLLHRDIQTEVFKKDKSDLMRVSKKDFHYRL